MPLFLLLLASVAYAAGGLFMKHSDGVTHLLPTLAFVALFCSGAVLQALGMKHAEMGVSYVFVLGAEAIAAVALSALVLHEHYSVSRLVAIAMVVAGIAWLRQS
jgi:multidrug transporter EmrE-like cation transporter